MKNRILFIIVLGAAQLAFSQASSSKSTGGGADITLSIVMPESLEGLEDQHLSRLQSKISNLLTSQGFGAEGLPNGIVIYPKINLYADDVVNTGMQQLTVVRGELSLFIKQVDDQVVFASSTKTLSGSGRNRAHALDMLMNSIKPAEWQDFLTNGKQKIVRYYAERCDGIISQAGQLAQAGQSGRALAMLLNVPTEVPCYDKVKDKTKAIYQQYINERCAELLQSAKAKLTANDYRVGLAIVGQIDPASNCHKEANDLMRGIAQEMDQQSQREWDMMQKMWTDRVELEKHRQACARDVAVAYWQNRWPTYNYLVVIK
ncbi:MAG: hypothetical protein R2830_21070 [Saprospiraceae bacterium]